MYLTFKLISRFFFFGNGTNSECDTYNMFQRRCDRSKFTSVFLWHSNWKLKTPAVEVLKMDFFSILGSSTTVWLLLYFVFCNATYTTYFNQFLLWNLAVVSVKNVASLSCWNIIRILLQNLHVSLSINRAFRAMQVTHDAMGH